MQAEPAGALALRDYLTVLRSRRKVVVLTMLALAVPILVLSLLKTPLYSADAELLLQQRSSETLFDSNTGARNDPARVVQNEIRIIESEPVRAMVRQQIGDAPEISAAPILQTDLIRVTATSTDARRAAAAANAYATSYIDYRRKQAVDDTLAASQEVQSKISGLQAQIDKTPPEQRGALVDAQSLFQQKLDELQVDAALKQGGAQMVTPAVVPKSPSSPKPVRNTIVAAMLGVAAGVALAFLLEYLDDSVKSKDDLQRAAPGVPVLGLVPVVTGWRAKQDAYLISVAEPNSPVAEAYRALRTAIQFLALDHPMGTLQVTSANPREGKTTTLSNLAIALASTGQRVLVICCDLRRPRVHEFFGLDNDIGFTSALLGKVPLAGAIQPVPGQPTLSLLASGPLPPNPSELLASHRTAEVLATLRDSYDIVLLDSPPILPVTDALVLSGHVDATLLVAIAGTTTRKEASRAVELLRQVEAPLVGAVLNGVDKEGSDRYGYEYYRREEPEVRRGPRTRLRDARDGEKRPQPAGSPEPATS